LKQVNNKGKVITVDIDPKAYYFMDRLKTNPPLYNTVKSTFDNYIEVITSDSVDPELIKQLKKRTKNKKVIVTLDSCHNYEHVFKELNLYSELVSPGSYLIVQDTYIDDKEKWIKKFAACSGYKKSGGPRKAVREFLRKNHDFIVDESCERFLITFNPSGYLKKVTKK
jgi:cephalosporin hydroxylase